MAPSNVVSFDGFIEAKTASTVKRWDGTTRTCADWDSLRRDPDLWLEGGTCLVHLYAKGQSRRGPSFRLHFSSLLSAKCYPLIKRFIVNGPQSQTTEDLERWGRLASKRGIDIHIPAPVDKAHAFGYHLATRNFFAWLCGRPLVGDFLGDAFVQLLHSMNEFRTGVDNVQDLTAYLVAQGYADLVCQPDYALATLHLAESFQLSELYVTSFCHCVGMSDLLYNSTEYQHTRRATKKLLRKSRCEMSLRLYQASDMLRNFLDEELSESYLGVSAGAHAHLERFRSFLLSFYTTQLGYYPPRSFDPDLFRAMREDFEALYELLVDEGSRPNMSGGICTLQLIQSFDARCRYQSLNNPLPLIPEINQKQKSWLSRETKLQPDNRLLAHAALVKASNWKDHVFQNDLVRAYRKFEAESIVPLNKSDKREKVSVADARKVRWILIYAVYQVLRNVTDEPPEVRDEAHVPYHLAVNTRDLPPWETKTLRRRHTDLAEQLAERDFEIKPDIDYFALTQCPQPQPPSLARTLSRNSAVRNSLKILKSVGLAPAQNTSPCSMTRSDFAEKTPSLQSTDSDTLESRSNSFEGVNLLRPVSVFMSLRRKEPYERPAATQRDSFLTDLKRISRFSNRSVPDRVFERTAADEWDAMDAFIGERAEPDDSSAWGQYADLGGFKRLE